MAITSINIVDGPHVQANGERRGRVQWTFDDGRTDARNVYAPNAGAWANIVSVTQAEVEAAQPWTDAAQVVGDTAIAANKQATIKHVALAYLRRAYRTGDPWRAYRLFDRFNDYRVAQGWTVNQVVTQLSTVGLTQDEWDLMVARYSYLSQSGNVTVMQSYNTLLAGDTWGSEFR